MGNYDSIGVPVKGQRVSSGAFGIKVRDAIIDLDRRVSAYDNSTGVGRASSTSNLALNNTTEVAALTITGMTFKAGLAYEAIMRCHIAAATAGNLLQARIRKYNATPSSGTEWGNYYNFRGEGAAWANVLGITYLLNATAADITSDVNLNMQASVAAASAITVTATSTSPRFFLIKPVGFAVDYAGIGVQVT
jgi:hypothetical protein